MVFPEANTSRFIHSLGAMHLASRFQLASIENAKDETVEAFFSELERLVIPPGSETVLEDFDPLLLHDHGAAGGGLLASRLAFRAKLKDKEMVRRRRLFVAAEGALRLAALFHDLGHLPFSHDLEYAFESFAAEHKAQLSPPLLRLIGGPPHEVIGHELAEIFLRLLRHGQGEAFQRRAVYRLAREILKAEPPYDEARDSHASVLHWLHSLIDGELDADRGDYLLRDGRALGFEFAAYDLERLLDNVVLVHSDDIGFCTAVHESGISALESFFLSRSRSSQMMIRHHKNAQLGAALRHVSSRVFASGTVRGLLADLDQLLRWTDEASTDQPSQEEMSDLLERFARYDDAWWIEQLRALRTEDELDRACLELVLRRKKTLVSTWKRKGDLLEAETLALNERLKRFADAEGRVDWQDRRRALLEEGVLALSHAFKPIKRRPGGGKNETLMQIVTQNRGRVPAAEMSAIVRSLFDIWREEVHVHTFSIRAQPVEKGRIFELLGVQPGERGAATRPLDDQRGERNN
jgi:HD superfamily phosphohydrolase